MLPALADFGINNPVYIRKINKRSHWQPEGCESLETRAHTVVNRIFKPSTSNLHSLFRVETSEQFYGIIATLSAGRTPQNQDVDFLWIREDELTTASVKLTQSSEGECLFVKDLHFNAYITPESAEELCLAMMQADREAQRCKKNPHTKPILEYQKQRGCKATETSQEKCECVNK